MILAKSRSATPSMFDQGMSSQCWGRWCACRLTRSPKRSIAHSLNHMAFSLGGFRSPFHGCVRGQKREVAGSQRRMAFSCSLFDARRNSALCRSIRAFRSVMIGRLPTVRSLQPLDWPVR
jgi:hypothetical protein